MKQWLNNIITIDVETTGLEYELDKVVQISAKFKNKEFDVDIDYPEDFEEVRSIQRKVKNGEIDKKDVPPEYLKKYLTPYEPKDVPRVTMDEAIFKFKSFVLECYNEIHELESDTDFSVTGHKFIFLGQNTTFDIVMLIMIPEIKKLIEKYFVFKPLDLFTLAFVAQKIGLLHESNKLGLKHIYYELFPDSKDVKFHDSMEDVKATFAAWNKIIEMFHIRKLQKDDFQLK